MKHSLYTAVSFVLLSVAPLALCVGGQLLQAINNRAVVEDLLAFPRYDMQFHSDFIISEDLPSKNEPVDYRPFFELKSLTSAKDPSLPIEHEFVRMTSPSGTPYVCSYPILSAEDISISNPWASLNKTDSVQRAIALLKPLSNQCVYLGGGWWNYEFCHVSHLKQYHVEAPKTAGESPEITSEFQLGLFHPSDIKGAQLVLDSVKNAFYLQIKIGGGTNCELKNQPRSTVVKFYCGGEHRLLINDVVETSSCQYEIRLQSRLLCGVPGFKRPGEEDLFAIQCKQILSRAEAEDVDRSTKARAEYLFPPVETPPKAPEKKTSRKEIPVLQQLQSLFSGAGANADAYQKAKHVMKQMRDQLPWAEQVIVLDLNKKKSDAAKREEKLEAGEESADTLEDTLSKLLQVAADQNLLHTYQEDEQDKKGDSPSHDEALPTELTPVEAQREFRDEL